MLMHQHIEGHTWIFRWDPPLRHPLKLAPLENRWEPFRQKSQCAESCEHTCASPFLRRMLLLSFSEAPRVPLRLASRGEVGRGSLSQANPGTCLWGLSFVSVTCSRSAPSPAWLASVTVTSLGESRQPSPRSQPLLWPCLFCLTPLLCFPVPSFSKGALRITRTPVMRPFLHEAENPHIPVGAGADLPPPASLSRDKMTYTEYKNKSCYQKFRKPSKKSPKYLD